jgi:hypothetical protein
LASNWFECKWFNLKSLLLGNLYDFLKFPPGDQIQLEWHKKYDGIYTFWLGLQPVVAVSDYKLIVDSFYKEAEAFAGRAQETEYFNLVRGILVLCLNISNHENFRRTAGCNLYGTRFLEGSKALQSPFVTRFWSR